MPIVTVELIAPRPAAPMARALLDACSTTVREGRCVLSSDARSEPRIAVATVRFEEASERIARIEVRAGDGKAFAIQARQIVFQKSDQRVERWRTVGLTIATLVGDALAPTIAASEPTGVVEGAHATLADVSGSTPVAAAPPSAEHDTAAPPGPSVVKPPPTPETGATVAPSAGTTNSGLRHVLWAGIAGALGPGLESGGLRLGASLDLGLRPTALPVFARLSLGYLGRPRDSRGLSVQWETMTIGGGVSLGSASLRAEPRLGLVLENIHAAVTDPASGRSGSGDQLGLSALAGIDGVWEPSRFAVVATVEGFARHSPTQIVVKEQLFGTAAAIGWTLGLGARYFLE